MKKLFVMLLSLLTLSFGACENEHSTIIEGQVIYEDTEEPVAGAKIRITGERTTGFMTPDKQFTRIDITADEDGRFSISIEPHEEVTHYELSIYDMNADYIGGECAPEHCTLLQAGKKHTLIVRVKRK